ncbi:replication protein [Sulfurospirillum sp. 1612]|uniref:replication protein n=1 Tax=Sulfurospirillum sp. 1612 TaxID=3094835 RepID=UPI002F949A7F
MDNANFTQFPNDILDNISVFDTYEFAILSVIVRKTIGFNKKSDGISFSQFSELTGIGKTKVISSLKSLKDKQIIIASKQKTKSGSNSYTRYSLNSENFGKKVVRHTDNPSSPHEQGVVRHTNTQNKIIQKERENIYFSLLGDDISEAVEAYIQHVINESSNIRNKKSFQVSIRNKFKKKDLGTLEEFERYYLDIKCEIFNIRYQDKSFENMTKLKLLPYYSVKESALNIKFYLSFIDKTTDSKQNITFKTIYELRKFVMSLEDKGDKNEL